MKLVENQKRNIVSKIKQSDTFKNAPTSIALLQYLFNATSNGEQLKESVIDIDFFGNKNSSDRTNPRVRVNVYNLRKKITQYYEKEGKGDKWRLVIEKGQYHIKFYKYNLNNSIFKKLRWHFILPYLALATILTILVFNYIPQKKSSLWKPFLNNDRQTNLYIGDHFGVMGSTITKSKGWTRDFTINNADEFYDFINKNPELKDSLKPSKYSYTTRMAAIASQKLQSFFQNYNKPFSIRFSTQTSTSEIKEGNAIYTGPSKNDNQFLYFFNQNNPYFEISKTSLKFSNHPSLADKFYSLNSGDETSEYAIVSKYSVDKNAHFVFFSQHDIGVSATVEYFTDVDNLENFKKNYLKEFHYFTAIFKVKGQDRTNTSIELISVIPF